MYPWLTVSQLFDWTLLEEQQAALAPQGPRENTASPDWIEAETGAGGVVARSGMSLETAGMLMVVGGTASAAIGAWSSARSEQNRAKSQALSLQHESTMSAITARDAEAEAQAIVESAHQDIGTLTLQAGAEEGERAAVMAGRGIVLGEGNAAEVQASGQFIKEVDVMSIGVNAARAAAAARTRGVNFRNQSLLSGISARNVRRSAGNDLLPASAAAGSLLTSGARLGAQWATDRRGPYATQS